MEKKLIIFDCFGVIVSEVAPFWLRERFSEDEAVKIKSGLVGDADLGIVGEKELYERLSAISGEPPQKIKEDWFSRAVFNEEVIKKIKKLKEKYTVTLLSNAVENMVQTLFGDRLYELFDEVIISSVEKIAKPDGKIFRLMLERTGYSAHEAIFIDDNPVNIGAAAEVGIDGILFKNAEQLDCLI